MITVLLIVLGGGLIHCLVVIYNQNRRIKIATRLVEHMRNERTVQHREKNLMEELDKAKGELERMSKAYVNCLIKKRKAKPNEQLMLRMLNRYRGR